MRSPLLLSVVLGLASCAHDSWSYTIDGVTARHTWTDGTTTVFEDSSIESRRQVRVEGEVDLGEDGSDLRLLGSGASFAVREEADGRTRLLEASRSDDGSTRFRYSEDGTRTEYGEEARAWFAGVVADLHRETWVGAEARAARLMASGRVEAVVAAAGQTESGTAVGIYFEAALGSPDLEPADAVRLVETAEGLVTSSSSMQGLLERAAAFAPQDDALTRAVLSAAERVSSSHSQGEVLEAVVPRLSAATAADFYRAAGTISSTSTRESVLVASLDSPLPTPVLTPGYLEAAGGISSSHSQGKALAALWARGGLDEAGRLGWATSAGLVSSTSTRQELFVEFFRGCPDDEAALRAALEAVGAISSSHAQGACLEAFLARPSLSKELLRAAEPVIRGISSTSTRSALQEQLLERLFAL